MKIEFKTYLVVICLVFTLCLSACSKVQVYSGDPLPREQVAFLKTDTTYFFVGDTHTRIISIDDKPVEYKPGRTLEVLPGRHEVVAELWSSFYTGSAPVVTQVLILDAKAGGEYQLKGKYFEGIVIIIDEKTGLIISEEKLE